jgi:hypothetical protein
VLGSLNAPSFPALFIGRGIFLLTKRKSLPILQQQYQTDSIAWSDGISANGRT